MLTRHNFRYGSMWIFLSIGALLYILVYTVKGITPNVNESCWLVQYKNCISLTLSILEKIADVLVIGAVLGYLSNVALFLELFKKDLEDIVNDTKHLEKRGDIDDIWDRVTIVLFKSKFDKISKRLLSLIKDNYFPVNKSVYYDNYTSDVKISWVGDPKEEVLNVRMENKYVVISENKDIINIPWKSWTKSSDKYHISQYQLFIDGNEVEIKKNESEENGDKTFEMNIPLCNKERYDVRMILEKQYSFDKDFFRALSTSFIMNGITLSISYPDDVDVELIERGTCGKFNVITKTSTAIVAKYDGLILPNQGYFLAMKHNMKTK